MEEPTINTTYMEDLLADLEMWADDNVDTAKEWLEEESENPDEGLLIDHINGIANELTGNDNGSYYCSTYKAKLAIEHNDLLTEEEFLSYLRDTDTHLEDIMDKGWEAVDVWGRCWTLDYKLTDEMAKEALEKGIAKHEGSNA